jgi:acetolactate decarboxylase
MHQVLAQGEDEARVRLGELQQHEDLYAIGAVAGLQGEITIVDSKAFVTRVGLSGTVEPLDPEETMATLLMGQSVSRWTTTKLSDDVAPEDFDAAVHSAAAAHGVDMESPFVFVLEGELTDVHLHVLNGACPVHARRHGLEIPEGSKPFEADADRIRGTLVGMYATHGAGSVTHSGTRTHAHVVFVDEATGERVTAHLERVGIASGATLRVPEPTETTPAAQE